MRVFNTDLVTNGNSISTLVFDSKEDLKLTIKNLQVLLAFKHDMPTEKFLAKYSIFPDTFDVDEVKKFTSQIKPLE